MNTVNYKEKNKVPQRVTAFILILCFLLQLVYFSPSASKAATSATHKDFFYLAGAHIDYSSTLSDDGIGPDGNRTYTLSVSISTVDTQKETSTDHRTAENGTYYVTDEGYYFIELWGGKGADGADTTASGGSAGGKGGAAGHIYAKVYLKKGQVLFYTLGGNGVPTSNATSGGGVNGDGGHHGSMGGDTVGGGGGYSALFLYNENEFENKYGSLDVKSIDENDRLSKYVMIAGGGGGGGAGNGQGLFNSAATGTADGGAGGSFSSKSGLISGANVIEGTFFAGGDGKSSGSSFDYIGRGGTNLPGAVPETFITNVSGYAPNDWAGTQNKSHPGGAGGSGNLRGGGGGAGFAGGSGGVMTGTLIPNNVGGGGGGSSFLASSINGEAPIYADLSSVPSKFIQDTNPSEKGGSFCITYLGEKDPSYFEDITIDTIVSPYFEITNATWSQGEFYYAPGTNSFNISGVSLLTSEGDLGGNLFFTITFKPINGFAGGNNVPLIAENSNMMCHATNDGGKTANTKIVLGRECRYVNVPLSLSLVTHSYRAGEPGEIFAVEDFYTDTYKDVRNNLESDLRYDFIESLSECFVTERGGNDILTGTVVPMRSTVYNVYFDVTVKDTGFALVGTHAASMRVMSTASVEVMTSVSTEIGKFAVTYTKTLTYDTASERYTYSLHVTSGVSGTGEILPDEGINHHQSYSSSEDSFEHPVAVSGYYMIRLWAGEGGQGAGSILGTDGGVGGARGYVGGYVYLEKGQYLKGTIGHNGSQGSSYSGGAGGDYTYVEVLDQNKQHVKYLAIAAGGGGGGGSFLWNQGKVGNTPSSTNSTLDAGGLEAYVGGIGGNGTLTSPGSSGSAHANYADKALGILLNASTDEHSPEAEAVAEVIGEKGVHSMLEALNTFVFDESTGGGAFTLHFLSSQTSSEEIIDEFDMVLSEYTLNTFISPYFQIVDVVGESLQYNTSTGLTEYGPMRNNSDLETVTPYDDGFVYVPNASVAGEPTLVTITDLNPHVVTETIEEGEHKHVHAYIDFTIDIILAPAEGFMGGNDVPIISSPSTFSHVQYEHGDHGEATLHTITLKEEVVTDYANVGITYDPPVLEGHDKFISPGEAVNRLDLFTLTGELPVMIDALGNDWRYDFVDVKDDYSAFFAEGDTVSPDVTTTYTLIIGVRPSAAPVKATVAEAAKAVVAKAEATVFVGQEVIYQLDGLETSDIPIGSSYFAPHGSDYSAKLTPHEGKFLPSSITVKVGEKVLESGVDYVYNRLNGEFTVYADAITDTVTIVAKAAKPSYKVHFIYLKNPFDTEYSEVVQSIEAGTTLENAIFNTYVPNEYEGDIPSLSALATEARRLPP